MVNVSSATNVRVEAYSPIVQHALGNSYFAHIEEAACPTCRLHVGKPEIVAPMPYRSSQLGNLKELCPRGRFLAGENQEYYLGTGKVRSNGVESYVRKEGSLYN